MLSKCDGVRLIEPYMIEQTDWRNAEVYTHFGRTNFETPEGDT